MAGQALEVAQHLKAGDPQAACAHRRNGGLHAVGVAHQIFGGQHDLGKTSFAHGLEFGLQGAGQRNGVHSEVAYVSAVWVHGDFLPDQRVL